MPVSYYGGNIVSGTSAAGENTDSYISDVVDGVIVGVVLPDGAGGNHTGIRIIAFLDGEGGACILGTAEKTCRGLAAPDGAGQSVSSHSECAAGVAAFDSSH